MPVNKHEHARILIVEDEPVLALHLEELLVDAGFAIAGIAAKLDKALALIERGACDAAIVDTNLAGVSASPIASALTARGVPFIVLSGYSSEQLPDAFSTAIFVRKPCRPAQIIQALNAIVLKQ